MDALKELIVGWVYSAQRQAVPDWTEPRYWKLHLPASELGLGMKRLYFEFLRLWEWKLDVVFQCVIWCACLNMYENYACINVERLV